MEIDDISDELFSAVFETTEKFHPDLTFQFAQLASHCEDEKDYIEKLIRLIDFYKRDISFVIDDIFQDNIPDTNQFNQILEVLSQKIQNLISFPKQKPRISLD